MVDACTVTDHPRVIYKMGLKWWEWLATLRYSCPAGATGILWLPLPLAGAHVRQGAWTHRRLRRKKASLGLSTTSGSPSAAICAAMPSTAAPPPAAAVLLCAAPSARAPSAASKLEAWLTEEPTPRANTTTCQQLYVAAHRPSGPGMGGEGMD